MHSSSQNVELPLSLPSTHGSDKITQFRANSGNSIFNQSISDISTAWIHMTNKFFLGEWKLGAELRLLNIHKLKTLIRGHVLPPGRIFCRAKIMLSVLQCVVCIIRNFRTMDSARIPVRCWMRHLDSWNSLLVHSRATPSSNRWYVFMPYWYFISYRGRLLAMARRNSPCCGANSSLRTICRRSDLQEARDSRNPLQGNGLYLGTIELQK